MGNTTEKQKIYYFKEVRKNVMDIRIKTGMLARDTNTILKYLLQEKVGEISEKDIDMLLLYICHNTTSPNVDVLLFIILSILGKKEKIYKALEKFVENKIEKINNKHIMQLGNKDMIEIFEALDKQKNNKVNVADYLYYYIQLQNEIVKDEFADTVGKTFDFCYDCLNKLGEFKKE